MDSTPIDIDSLEDRLLAMAELDPAELVDEAAELAETLTAALDALEEESPD